MDFPSFTPKLLEVRSKINDDDINIKTFEYGQPEDGDEISYAYTGVIPAFKTTYKINVMTQRPDLQKKVTYLRVQYFNALSKIVVSYDPENTTLTFYTEFPFVETYVGILGFAKQILNIENLIGEI